MVGYIYINPFLSTHVFFNALSTQTTGDHLKMSLAEAFHLWCKRHPDILLVSCPFLLKFMLQDIPESPTRT